MRSHAAIYHWWREKEDPPVQHNLRTPILLSIACLRAADPEIQIYVIDISDEPDKTLEKFSDPLGFIIFSVRATFETTPFLGNRHLSRIHDIHRLLPHIREKNITYVDSDVFYQLKPKEHSEDDHGLVFNGNNSGFFRFQKNQKFNNFFEQYDAVVRTSILDSTYRTITRQSLPPDSAYLIKDEAILRYMMLRLEKPQIGFCDSSEYTSVVSWKQKSDDNIRMIHLNSLQIGDIFATCETQKTHARGLFPLLVNNLRLAIRQQLGNLEVAYSTHHIQSIKPVFDQIDTRMYQQLSAVPRAENSLYYLISDSFGEKASTRDDV